MCSKLKFQLAYSNPSAILSLPVIGTAIHGFITQFPIFPVVTNIFALAAHVGEALYALYLCNKANIR